MSDFEDKYVEYLKDLPWSWREKIGKPITICMSEHEWEPTIKSESLLDDDEDNWFKLYDVDYGDRFVEVLGDIDDVKIHATFVKNKNKVRCYVYGITVGELWLEEVHAAAVAKSIGLEMMPVAFVASPSKVRDEKDKKSLVHDGNIENVVGVPVLTLLKNNFERIFLELELK